MGRALQIAVRFHQGRYHGAGSWPPAPGRLFQALVAAAARGARLEQGDAGALAWLERLDPPEIAAPPARAGQAMKTYVPNNDLDAVDGDPARVPEIKTEKTTRPLLFDVAVPILYHWRFDGETPEAAAVCAITHRLYQLGRGSDMAWATGEVLTKEVADEALAAHPGAVRRPGGPGDVAVPTVGTLASLVVRHEAFRHRFSIAGTGRKARRVFAQPPKPLLRRVGYDAAPRRLLFDFRRGDAFAPRPLASAAPLTASLRDAAAAGLAAALPERAREVERLLAGRGADAADKARRVRLIPLPSIGHAEAAPSIRRLAAELPPDCPLRADDVAWAFAGLAPSGDDGAEARLVTAEDDRMARRYRGPACRWRTVTAAALPGARRRVEPAGADGKGGRERAQEEARAAGAVRRALRHAGIGVSARDIRVQREPFQRRGARAEAFASGTRFARNALWHVELTFEEPVSGPLIVGDGRFCGLGLMAPAEPRDDGVFILGLAMAPRASAAKLAAALRRAVMARAREATSSEELAPFFTGHAADGAPLRGGGRTHIACAADPARQRLLVLAPHVLDRRAPEANEPHHLRTLARAVSAVDRISMGRDGMQVVTRRAATPGDPLLAPARFWESVTPYRPTRHPKREDAAGHIAADVAEECRRRSLPAPETKVLTLEEGPRGGLAARLRLVFPRPVGGPMLLGRDAQRGGGLFADAGDE